MTLREHIEAIRDEYWSCTPEAIESRGYHAKAALAILDFKPLDSDLPETGESYPPTAT